MRHVAHLTVMILFKPKKAAMSVIVEMSLIWTREVLEMVAGDQSQLRLGFKTLDCT